MTSRPPLGVQQRPPQQRTLSGPSLSQRPLPPSPIRKETTVIDLTSPEASDSAPAAPLSAAPSQHNTRYLAQRRGGSRLRLELKLDALHDGVDDNITQAGLSESPNAIESSKPFTPSRIMPPGESSDLGEMSPNPSIPPPTTDMDAPMPFPQRRMRHIPPDNLRERLPPPMPPPRQAKKDAPKKDNAAQIWKVEIPADAPRYYIRGDGDSQAKKMVQGGAAGMVSGRTSLPSRPSVGYADFFPWTGNHPEDKFSDNIIRQGNYDRPGFNPNPETQSAKATLFPALKGKSGLNALSQLFTAMLGHRRHHTHITTHSTFRPPPRVTIPDSKREIWLNDLANPATPLRKFSRTIPHGIRGQVLLEQCLNKRIPIDRAVWLTKCVGANEIRACKRSKGGVGSTLGLGAEIRWVKEWTSLIEKFVENALFSFDDKEWKSKVNYSIMLATNLYEHHLLDREHYLEWLVASFESANQQKLPMWMLVTQIYWKDILKLRKYGRRLVAALVSHHHLVFSHPDKDLLKSLPLRLTRMLNTLILGSPENFVCPSVWFKYRDTIKTCLPTGDEARLNSFLAISSRNEQLVAYANRSQPATRHILVQLLDRTLQQPIPEELPQQCWNISKDKSALARALLEWCTSLYRPGKTKVYVANRILRHWSTLGLDVTQEILKFLDTDPCEEMERKGHFYHVVCELVRNGVFSVPYYAQWLIGRGGLTNPNDVLPNGPAATRLLAEIPPGALPVSQQDIRTGILRRAAFSVADEAQNADLALKCIKQILGLPLDPNDPILRRKPWSIRKLSRNINSSGRALKAEVGRWLRDSLVVPTPAPSAVEKGKAKARGPQISSAMFDHIRHVLEAAEDLSMLSDILRSLIECSCIEVLAAITNTVCRHVLVFAALGVSKLMFIHLHKRLRILYKEQGLAARPLLAALVSLAPRVPGMEDLSAVLTRDLAMSDRRNPVDACSPVSDNMLARLQDDDSDLEEIEKILATGTSMDKKTLENLFHTIAQRLQAYWDKDKDRQRAYSMLLTRLRRFDIQHFDTIMGKWLAYLRTDVNRPSVIRIYPLLVSVGCLGMHTILSTTSDSSTIMPPPGNAPAWPQMVQITSRTRYLQDVLCLLMTPIPPDYDLITSEEIYRFSNLQEQILRDNPKELLNLVGLAMAEYLYARSMNDSGGLPLDDNGAQQRFSQLIKLLVLKDAAGVGKVLSMWASRNPDAFSGSWIDDMTTKLLIPTADRQIQVTFDQVLELTNEFTWPFCQVQLILSSSANAQNGQQAAERQQSHLDLLTNAMDRAIDKKNITWVGIVHSLNPEVSQHLRSRAQTRFLALIPSLRDPPPPDTNSEQALQVAENLLSVIEALMRGGPANTRQLQLVPDVAVKLMDLWELLCAPDFDNKQLILSKWLPIVLNFITLHSQGFDSSKPSSELRGKLLVVCAGLIQELDYLHGPDLNTRSLSKRIFDLSCVLSDNLPEDMRNLCIRAVKESSATADPRMRYVFGITSAPQSENLWLCQRERITPAAAVSSASAASVGGSGPGRGPAATGGLTAINTNTNTISNNNNNNNIPSSTAPIASMILGTPPTLWGVEKPGMERLSPFTVKKWDIVNVPPQSVGENDTSLSLALFEARGQRAWPK
ncbi:putative mediator of RNA polymerase II transcription [Cladorrhinum sp. PSN259]|nr:putative mediator of RNA polymerase II transcription [Cladorrhinum sp. PSN259]